MPVAKVPRVPKGTSKVTKLEDMYVAGSSRSQVNSLVAATFSSEVTPGMKVISRVENWIADDVRQRRESRDFIFILGSHRR